MFGGSLAPAAPSLPADVGYPPSALQAGPTKAPGFLLEAPTWPNLNLRKKWALERLGMALASCQVLPVDSQAFHSLAVLTNSHLWPPHTSKRPALASKQLG